MAENPMQTMAEAIRGKSDDEIEGGAALAGGPKGILDMLFEGMRQGLKPDRAEDCAVEYMIVASDAVLVYRMVIEGGKATVESRQLPKVPVVSIVTTYPDFVRLMAGELDGMQAALSGRLQIAGDAQLAGRLGEMFGS